MPSEPLLTPEKLEILVGKVVAAESPWVEALVVLDRLLGLGWKQTTGKVLEALTARLEAPAPVHKAELVLRRLQLSVHADDDVVREAALREVLDANPSHTLALAGLAEILVRTGRRQEGVRICRALLGHHRETLPPAVRARAYTYLAQARMEEEDGHTPANLRRARTDLEKALDAAPDHAPARQLLAEICYSLDLAEKGLALLEEAASYSSDPVGKLCEASQELLVRSGRADHVEHLLQAACKLSETDLRPLRLLIELHREGQRWEAVVRDLAALAARAALQTKDECRPERAAAFHTMGQLYEEKLGDPGTALSCYLQALDLSPDLLESFERASALLLSAQDWRSLEEHHRLMLQRLGTTGPAEVRAALWKNLGQIHRVHMKRYADAALAYEAVLRLRPADEEALEALVEIYERLPARAVQQRIKLHRSLLALRPFRVASLHQLHAACLEQGELDEAWCLAARLVAEERATPEEEAFYHNLMSAEPPRSGAIPDASWGASLRHPDQSAPCEQLLSQLAAILYPLFAGEQRSPELRQKDAVPADAPLMVNRVVQRVGESLGLASLPSVYRSSRPGCRLAATLPPVLLLGEEQFAGRTLRELTVTLAREMIQLRPGHVLPFCLDLPGQRWLLRCLLAFFGAGSPPEDSVQARRVQEVLEQGVPTHLRPGLTELARTIAGDPTLLEGDAYRRGLQATGGRFALLLSEDLPATLQTFAGEEASLAEDLRLFSVSAAYLRLRRELGFALLHDVEGGEEEAEE